MLRPAGIAFLSVLLVQPALAQSVLKAPDAIRGCLCAEQAVEELAVEVRQRGEFLATRRNELASLDAQEKVAAGGEQARLARERSETAKIIAAVLAPLYADSRTRYASASENFARNCARKTYDPVVLARVRVGLVCVGARTNRAAPVSRAAPPPRFSPLRGCCNAPDPMSTRPPRSAP